MTSAGPTAAANPDASTNLRNFAGLVALIGAGKMGSALLDGWLRLGLDPAKLAVFEPTHGSAPKYAGQYKVNPIATILAVKMMLDWLGESKKAIALEAAVAQVIQEGKVRTYDMGGTSTTMQMAQAVAEKL